MGEESAKLDIPESMQESYVQLRAIKWCDGHWSELMFALKDRGLEKHIAADAEELNAKFRDGKLDPCWEASNTINVGALEIFGPDRIIEENNGCPVCAFANIIEYMSDAMSRKYGDLN